MYRIHWQWVVINGAVSTADMFVTVFSLIVISQCIPCFAIQLVSSLFIRQPYEHCLRAKRRSRYIQRVAT
jgi:hypothetical protein